MKLLIIGSGGREHALVWKNKIEQFGAGLSDDLK